MARSRKPSKPRPDLYQEITDRIVAALESGDVAPWQRPWKSSFGGGLPRNVKGNAYRGINVWLTLLTQWERGYSAAVWLTFKQANEIAAKAMRAQGRAVVQTERGSWVFGEGDPEAGHSVGGVRKGQNAANGCGATKVVFWKSGKSTETSDDGEETERAWMMMRAYSVFNVEQCDAHVVDYLRSEADERPEFSPIEACEKICEDYLNEVSVAHGGDQAYYSPIDDRIHLPERDAFRSPEHYYSTRFHEMAHSTGHASRLNRPGVADFDAFGSHQYAEEELVAEFAASFLAGAAGIERTTETHSASYLKNWAAKLKDDKKLVVMAAQRAQKAADFMLGTAQRVAEAA